MADQRLLADPLEIQATIWPWTCMSGEATLGPAVLQLKEESRPSVRWALGGGPVLGDTALREGAPWEGPVCSGEEE